MKNIILFIGLLFSNNVLTAQNPSSRIPISIGYFSNFGFQPGLKIGTQIDFKKWKTDKIRRKGDFKQSKSFFVSPQIGFFARPENNVNLLLGTDIGYQKINLERRSFSAVSIGLGYLTQSQIISIVYNLNDGSVKEKKREWRSYFLPTLNYEIGRAINSKMNWYVKPSVGLKLSSQEKNAMVILIEVGLKFHLQK